MGVMAQAQPSEGLKSYYQGKIEEFELAVRDKTQNLRRLEAQRNELNGKGARLLLLLLHTSDLGGTELDPTNERRPVRGCRDGTRRRRER